jgi:hypothetical protein
MAGESRQTQVIANVNRIGSDNAIKVFDLTNTVLASTAGWAFLQPQGSTMAKNISSLIEDFKPTIPEGSSVQAIAALLWTRFNAIYQEHIAQLPAQAVTAGQTALTPTNSAFRACSCNWAGAIVLGSVIETPLGTNRTI